MDYKNLKRVIELIRENDLREFEMEEEGFRLSVKRGAGSEPIQVAPSYTLPAPAPVPAAVAESADAGAGPGETVDVGNLILSPMVGTFYTASSPDAKSFVSVGDEVGPDTVVCIIEAMKVMNEIKAETAGVIRELMVENATPVEYDQPLYRIDPL